jgi:hypothetical protein
MAKLGVAVRHNTTDTKYERIGVQPTQVMELFLWSNWRTHIKVLSAIERQGLIVTHDFIPDCFLQGSRLLQMQMSRNLVEHMKQFRQARQ